MNRITLIIYVISAVSFNTLVIAADVDVFAAARTGDVNAINAYADNGGNVNTTNNKSYTPFMLAAYYGHTPVIDALLQIGADACVVDSRGNNAFMGVAFKGHQQVTKWLLDNTQCDVNHQNYAGQTALMMASLFGREEIIKLLLDYGAKPDLSDHQGNTAEKLAQAQGLSRVVEIIKFQMQ